jgi:O-antigen/teichoic acid export membrane protein
MYYLRTMRNPTRGKDVIVAVTSLSKGQFLRHNFVFFIGSMAVAFLNYLYHPALSRFMSVQEFGELQALLSIFLQLNVLLSAFGLVIVHVAANVQDRDEWSLRLGELYTLIFSVTGFIALFFLLFSPFLKEFFKFSSVLPFVAFSAVLITATPFVFHRSQLQGNRDFIGVSLASGLAATGRLVLGILLILLGMSVFGGLIGFALAQVLAVGYILLLRRQHDHARPVWKPRFQIIKQELSYSLLLVIATGFITFLYTADVVLVKYLFSPETAGLYAGISTVGKIIFFATGSIAGVLLPSIKQSGTTKENHDVFLKSLALTLAVGVPSLLLFSFFPEFFISLLVGKDYLELASLLPPLGLAVFLVSLTNLFYFYFLALRRHILFLLSFTGLLSLATIMLFFHGSIAQIVNSILASSLIAFTMVLPIYGLEYVKNLKTGAVRA